MPKNKHEDTPPVNQEGSGEGRRLPIAALVASIGVTGILAAILVTASSWMGINSLDTQQQKTVDQRSISEDGLRVQYNIEDLIGAAGIIANNVQEAASDKRAANVNPDSLKSLEDTEKRLANRLNIFHTQGMSAENLGRVESMRNNFKTLQQHNAAFREAVKNNKLDDATSSYKQVNEQGKEFLKVASDLYQRSDNRMKEASAEFDAAANQARIIALLSVLLGGVLTAGLTFWLVKRIRKSLDSVAQAVDHMSNGNYTEPAHRLYNDELGDMCSTVDGLRTSLQKVFAQVGTAAQEVGTAATDVDNASSHMVNSANNAASVLADMSESTSEMARSVDTVAAGTEEMTASIREIAKSANDAAGVAGQAVSVADATTATVAKLGESSTEIGNVIKVITSIAEQTNLLALNATIEAARAGEAGKGFAVVANEVKELAQETSKATEDISRRIEEIQHDTEAAVSAISEIATIIAQINDTQSTIASAVEEQTATTNEMGRNVTEVSGGSQTLAQGVGTVALAAQDNSKEAQELVEVASGLRGRADQLQQLVSSFKY